MKKRPFRILSSIHLLPFLSGFNLTLFSCDFETRGSRSFCGWKDDPRDNGVTWSIVNVPQINSNVLCLSPSLKRNSVEDDDYNDGEYNRFDTNDSEDNLLRAKLWSPKYRAAKGDSVPQCLKFDFKFESTENAKESFKLSLMRHSTRC